MSLQSQPLAPQTYQRLVESLTSYAVVVLNAEGTIRSWNAGAERLTGFASKQMVGKNVVEFFSIEDNTPLLAPSLRASAPLTMRVRTASGAQQSVVVDVGGVNSDMNAGEKSDQHQQKHHSTGEDVEDPLVWVMRRHEPPATHPAWFDTLPDDLQSEIERRVHLEEQLIHLRQEFENRMNQRTDLLQEAILQLQEEVARRDDVEGKLRQRTEIMHDFIQQLEQEMEERKQMEATLRHSEERFRTVIERSPIGICIADELGTVEYINPAFGQIFGFTPQEMMHSPLANIVGVAERTSFETAYKGLFDTSRTSSEQRGIRGEWSMRNKQGGAITVLTDAAPISQSVMLDEFGGIARPFGASSPAAVRGDGMRKQVLFAMDITQRKNAEDLYKRAKVVIDQSPAVIYQFANAPGYPIDFISDNVIQFGFTPEDIIHPSHEIQHTQDNKLWYIHPDDIPNIRALFRLLRGKKIYHLRREFRLLTKEGGARWVENNLVATRDADGSISHYQGVLIDITDRKNAEEELSRAITKERELLNLKARFITIASHEFRTPLTSIMLAAGILKDFGSLLTEEQRDENLGLIKVSVEHMTQLLEDLLMFDRVDGASLNFKPSDIDLHTWCEEFFTRKQNTSGRSHVLHWTVPEEGHIYTGDETMLTQILDRLLSNAFKYSPSGTAVSVDARIQDNAVFFEIRDSGIGIPNEDIERIFEPFHRGSNIGEIGGSGMGLAILHKLVELHGGDVDVRSEIGIGTTITLRLPLSAADIFLETQTAIRARAKKEASEAAAAWQTSSEAVSTANQMSQYEGNQTIST
jgi:PAS domain S-box-containing protein